MISEFNAAQSCLTKLKGYAATEGFSIAIEGKTEGFESDVIYLEERFFSEQNSQGINNNSSQFQSPIYQVSIHTPKIMGKWKGLEIYDELVTHFERQSDISLDSNQKVRIDMVDKVQLPATETHNLTIASISLTLIG